MNTKGFSVEVKLLSRPSFGDMLNAVRQAANARENEDDLPVAVVKKKYADDSDTLFIMRRDDFLAWFIGGTDETS